FASASRPLSSCTKVRCTKYSVRPSRDQSGSSPAATLRITATERELTRRTEVWRVTSGLLVRLTTASVPLGESAGSPQVGRFRRLRVRRFTMFTPPPQEAEKAASTCEALHERVGRSPPKPVCDQYSAS